MSIFNRLFKPARRSRPKPNPVPISNKGPEMEYGIPKRITRDHHNVRPIGMSYWRNINNHANEPFLYVALSIDDQLKLLKIDKNDLEVLHEIDLYLTHTGEGIYFSAINPNKLYIPINGVLNILNINDVSQLNSLWIPANPEHKLYQIHTSWNDNIHSASVKDFNYNVIGWAVSSRDGMYELKGQPDECQIDKSGNWLLIKENNYNRIIYIPTGAERIIQDNEGAVGHSDCGWGIVYGEDDWFQGLVSLDFTNGVKHNLYKSGENMGYVSVSKDKKLMTRPDKLILFDEYGYENEICPTLAEDQSYENRPKANLCPLGQFAVWTAFVNGRLDAYIVRIP